MTTKADVLKYGSGYNDTNTCRCTECKTIFEAGGRSAWHNHYYCCQECARKANECSNCGENRHQCGCVG